MEDRHQRTGRFDRRQPIPRGSLLKRNSRVIQHRIKQQHRHQQYAGNGKAVITKQFAGSQTNSKHHSWDHQLTVFAGGQGAEAWLLTGGNGNTTLDKNIANASEKPSGYRVRDITDQIA